MSLSLRKRLILALGLVLLLATLVVRELVHMTQSSLEQRMHFTRSLVEQELEHMAVAPEGERATLTGLRSGIARARAEKPVPSGLPADVDSVLHAQIAVAPVGTRKVIDVPSSQPGPGQSAVSYWVGVLGRDDGSVVWVAYPQRQPQYLARFRQFSFALAGLLLTLAALTLFTIAQVGRGVRSLTSSLRAIDADLRAEVPAPNLDELRAVAEGIRALARNLAQANEARATLADELARRERLAGLGRVVAGVAHEVRNPLASLKLRIDLALGDAGVAPALREDLQAMRREVDRLDRLVADLLVLGGRRPRSRVDIAVDELVRERVELLAPWAEERGVSLRLEHSVHAERPLDRDGVAQALDNLLRNAVEASPSGASVRVRVTCNDDGQLGVSVEDEGPGIPEERAGQLFEPFFTTKSEGLGLGLATAHALAVAEGGDLHYTRDAGTTRFTLQLP